ncbi:hypothetical protein HIM_03329 [Hirsutella minnesotensis 3608]|uniref:Zn(2)-C6 fungal-type domain-containing protein n=1 Tax=Hirsutella minnesotensis 3608 TaxID=1043627 RepID=A0A0F7ZVQ2_9HYPO|nr:hypothetical protein HIM_03329 [Hirsutella minnesotensis 3608]
MSLFKQLMANTKSRSSGGCWTCRVRRKKCAENRPVCDTCKALDITCHFEEEKPDWMDGGPKQRDMAEVIKAEVKKQASQRRDRKYLEILERGTKLVTLNDDGDVPMSNAVVRMDRDGPSANSDTDRSPSSHETNSTPPSSQTAASPPELPWHIQNFQRNDVPDPVADGDLRFLMIYLDYVFPYLFPHYRPSLLEGGRFWILDSIHSNKSVYHTTISLASSFFAITLAGREGGHEECVSAAIRKLDSQLELGLKELRKEMSALNASKAGFDIPRGLVVMQSIVQMLLFEVATSNKDNWRMHLDAAVALFLQILPNPENWGQTLSDLQTPHWPPQSLGDRRPWSTSQAALRFFSATLLYLDVVSSATLGDAPRLRQYQMTVIPGCPSMEHETASLPAGPLFLEDFFGLPNWVIQVLGDVAALDAWKQMQIQAGTLSGDELAARGQVLGDPIKGGLEMLNQFPDGYRFAPAALPVLVADPVTGSEHRQEPEFKIIWLLAIQSYLKIVILGWQPTHPEIRCSVAKATERLSRFPAGSCLRALAWPLCVCGCLSPAEDEDTYRAVGERLGPLKIFGTVNEALEIMEAVWSQRDGLDETWTLSNCLNILGHGVLLI